MQGQSGFKNFWLRAALGLLCIAMGAAMLWITHVTALSNDERKDWLSGEARLYEVGIRWNAEDAGAVYRMTARYVLTVAGRDYDGGEIAGGYASKAPAEVRSLIVPFAAEASEFSLQDLGPLNPERSWSIAYRPVAVRYDAADPSRSQMVLDRPIVHWGIADWLRNGIAALLLLAGSVLCALALVSKRVQ